MPRLTPSIAISVVFHAALLALALWLLSRQEPPADIRIGSVPVTIVSDVVREAAPTPAPAEEVFDEVTPDASETADSEATQAPSAQPAPPRPTPPRQPTQPTRPPQNPTRPPQTPPRQPPAQPQRPPPDSLDLENLTGGSGPPRRPPGRPPTESGSGDAPVATGPQVAVLVAQIGDHWNMTFCSMAGGDDLDFRVLATVDNQGRLVGAPRVERPQSGSVFQAASESAIRAIRLAAPFDVPAGFRTSVVPFRFNTSRACAAL